MALNAVTPGGVAMSERFQRINLAEVEDVERELIFYEMLYRGLNNKIVGPTGAGKTLLAARIVLEHTRAGGIAAHFDQEIGEGGSKATYKAHGATDAELATIHYVAFPSPRPTEVQQFVQDILDEGEDLAVFDKKPDFLRSLRLAENSNDDQSDFYGTLIDPLRNKVTTIILAPTGHAGDYGKGSRARGGSESDYKYDAIWQMKVGAPFNRETVGQIRLECTKDRWGYIGYGTAFEFEIGGDAKGGIVFRQVVGTGPAPREVSLKVFLRMQAIEAGRQIAPTRDDAKDMNDYLAWLDKHLPAGRRGSKEQRIAAVKEACELPDSQDRLVEVDTGVKRGRHDLAVRYYAAGEGA